MNVIRKTRILEGMSSHRTAVRKTIEISKTRRLQRRSRPRLLLRVGFDAFTGCAFESTGLRHPTGDLLLSQQLLRLRDFRGEAILTFRAAEPGP